MLSIGPFYIYDHTNVDMAKLADPNVYTIGLASSKESEDTIVEKIAALTHVNAIQNSGNMKLSPFAKLVGSQEPSIDDIKSAELQKLIETNRVVSIKPGFWNHIRDITRNGKMTEEQAILFELGNYIDAAYMEQWRQHVGI